MKLSNALLGVAALAHSINAAATPDVGAVAIDSRTPEPEFEQHSERSTNEELWKRKGGGGGGGRGSSSGGGSRGGSSGSSSGGGRSSGLGSTTSNSGGRTTTGSGAPAAYRGSGGRSYYGGGATAPYSPGSRSPSSSIAPALLTGAALGGIGFLGVSYLYGAYSYPYTHQYTYHNATTNMNETKPVTCVCDRYEPCTCDDNGDQAYFDSIIGNGTWQGLNHTLVTVAKENGKDTILINGGVPNGTTAPGGTEDPNAAGGMMALARAAGWWPAASAALALSFLM